MSQEIENAISADPLFRKLAHIASHNKMDHPTLQVKSGKIYSLVGKYATVPDYLLDSLMIALEDTPKTTWKIGMYVIRMICGTVNIIDSNTIIPNTSIEKRVFYDHPVQFMNKWNIKGRRSYFQAFENLERKKILIISEDEVKPNWFPLTWNIEDIRAREIVEEIVKKEMIRLPELSRRQSSDGNSD